MQWYWQKQAESSWRTDWENIVEPAAANTTDAEHREEDNAVILNSIAIPQSKNRTM